MSPRRRLSWDESCAEKSNWAWAKQALVGCGGVDRIINGLWRQRAIFPQEPHGRCALPLGDMGQALCCSQPCYIVCGTKVQLSLGPVTYLWAHINMVTDARHWKESMAWKTLRSRFCHSLLKLWGVETPLLLSICSQVWVLGVDGFVSALPPGPYCLPYCSC